MFGLIPVATTEDSVFRPTPIPHGTNASHLSGLHLLSLHLSGLHLSGLHLPSLVAHSVRDSLALGSRPPVAAAHRSAPPHLFYK